VEIDEQKDASSRYIEFYIENKRVGRLIGKEGSTLKQIQRYTFCKIYIHQGACEMDGAKKGTIHHDDSGLQCYIAKRMIQTLFPKCVWKEKGEFVTV